MCADASSCGMVIRGLMLCIRLQRFGRGQWTSSAFKPSALMPKTA
jgi:hypothetical protein